jgi:hypothetical protein
MQAIYIDVQMCEMCEFEFAETLIFYLTLSFSLKRETINLKDMITKKI